MARIRTAGMAVVPVALLLGLVEAGPGRTWAQEPTPQFSLGIAHVDYLELHAERLPDAPARDAPAVTGDELAERYRLGRETGARWHRWSLYWDLVERHGRFELAAGDGIVVRDRRAGLEPLVILQGIPAQYALDGPGGLQPTDPSVVDGPNGGWRSAGAIRGLHEPAFRTAAGQPTDDPARGASIDEHNPWAVFVDAVAERYRPGGPFETRHGVAGVRTWEIGNEPNLRHFWRGSPADFARLLEVATLVIHRRDPGATIVHGGIGDDGNAAPWYEEFLRALDARAAASPLPAAHGRYFDKASWHWYSTPEKMRRGLAEARRLLAAHGLAEKPLWLTEVGIPVWSEYPGPCWDPASPLRATVAEQSAFLWQALAEARAAGAEAAVYFQLFDDCGNGSDSYDALGLVRNPGATHCWLPPQDAPCWRPNPALAGRPRGAYEAFQVFAREVAPARLVRSDDSETVRAITFSRAPFQRLTLAWAKGRGSEELTLVAAGSAIVHAIEADGSVSSRPASAVDGVLRATLPGATNRNGPGGGSVVEGRPVLVVETDDLAPTAAVAPLPEVSEASFELEVQLGDTGSGVASYRVLHARVRPQAPADWEELVSVTPWTGPRAGGSAAVSFSGEPGTHYFAAVAVDRAGNWGALGRTSQAHTRIAAPTPTPKPPAARTATMPRGLAFH